jgi:hypothetical protein
MCDSGTKGMTGRHGNVHTEEVVHFQSNELDNEKLINTMYFPDQMCKIVLENIWKRLA